MDDDTIQDLKQFISATISQQTTDLREDIHSLDGRLTTKIDDLSSSVADALDQTSEIQESRLKDHENRITRLEQKAA